MNLKQIIIFVFLTTLLIAFMYGLLDAIDNHKGIFRSLLLGLMVIVNIAFITGYFLRFMKSPNHREK
ncbi:MAG: hypothetical protein QM768_19995 [Agriterribacter sp.]